MLDIIVGGKSLYHDFLFVVEVEKLEPPEPKFYSVDVPGGNGKIQLTTAVFGDTAYHNRVQEFKLTLRDMNEDFERWKTKLSNFLHGREFDYTFSWDEGYTYHGWFSVSSYERRGNLKQVTLKVDADPYKTKGVKTYKLNANGGNVYRFESGRKQVQPVFECSNPTIIGFGDVEFMLPQGAYKCPDIWFKEGWNEVYINSWQINTLKWAEIGKGGAHAMTWDEAESYRWFELEKMGSPDDVTGVTWDELCTYRWDELAAKTWEDVTYQDAGGRSFTTHVSYEWSDL